MTLVYMSLTRRGERFDSPSRSAESYPKYEPINTDMSAQSAENYKLFAILIHFIMHCKVFD